MSRFVEVLDADGVTRWRVDAGFLGSRWRCLWGDGCQGIHDEPRPDLGDGCCSVGVVLADAEEAMTVSALAAVIDAELFEHRPADGERVVEGHGSRWHTRVVDGACIFLNRPGFAGGAGCALHLAAVAAGERPADWKPQTCVRLPIRVEERRGAGHVEVTVRAWTRADWGPGGATMAWWCTEADEAFTSDTPLVISANDVLVDLMGHDLAGVVTQLVLDQGEPA